MSCSFLSHGLFSVPFTNAGFDYSRHILFSQKYWIWQFLIVHLQAQQADASATALWAIFKEATCQGHLLFLQLFPAAGSSDAVHEHQWYHGTAETATQLVQKLPVSEVYPFLLALCCSVSGRHAWADHFFHQKSFIYLVSRCCISIEYWVTEEEIRVHWSWFESDLWLDIKLSLTS